MQKTKLLAGLLSGVMTISAMAPQGLLTQAATDTSVCWSAEEAAPEIREHLRARDPSFTIYMGNIEDVWTVIDEAYELALQPTSDPAEGDYIALGIYRYDENGGASYDENGIKTYSATFDMTYNADAEQNQEAMD